MQRNASRFRAGRKVADGPIEADPSRLPRPDPGAAPRFVPRRLASSRASAWPRPRRGTRPAARPDSPNARKIRRGRRRISTGTARLAYPRSRPTPPGSPRHWRPRAPSVYRTNCRETPHCRPARGIVGASRPDRKSIAFGRDRRKRGRGRPAAGRVRGRPRRRDARARGPVGCEAPDDRRPRAVALGPVPRTDRRGQSGYLLLTVRRRSLPDGATGRAIASWRSVPRRDVHAVLPTPDGRDRVAVRCGSPPMMAAERAVRSDICPVLAELRAKGRGRRPVVAGYRRGGSCRTGRRRGPAGPREESRFCFNGTVRRAPGSPAQPVINVVADAPGGWMPGRYPRSRRHHRRAGVATNFRETASFGGLSDGTDRPVAASGSARRVRPSARSSGPVRGPSRGPGNQPAWRSSRPGRSGPGGRRDRPAARPGPRSVARAVRAERPGARGCRRPAG